MRGTAATYEHNLRRQINYFCRRLICISDLTKYLQMEAEEYRQFLRRWKERKGGSGTKERLAEKMKRPDRLSPGKTQKPKGTFNRAACFLSRRREIIIVWDFGQLIFETFS
jgi:hypothetical protein